MRIPDQFTIRQLAAAANVPTTTVRYYERLGLLRPDARTTSNYRAYSRGSLERLTVIRNAQAAGLTLEDVRTLFAADEGREALCGEVQAILTRRLTEIDARIAELAEVKKRVVAALATCKCGAEAGLCGTVIGLRLTPPRSR